jgi:hypothetical protein
LALRQVLGLRTRFHRALATICLLYFLVSIPSGVIFDVTADVFFWFFAGLLMVAMRLDREAVRAAAQAAAPPSPAPALVEAGEAWQRRTT